MRLLPLFTLLPVAAAAQDPIAVARAYRETHAPMILRHYAETLALPNVASDSANIARNADHLVGLLRRHGVPSRVLTRPGVPPLVYGRMDVPGATRTIGIYVHYDGQPAGTGAWVNPPWQPQLYTGPVTAGGIARPWPADGEAVNPEWRIYGRSASDDKAPFAALFPTLSALQQAGIQPTSNVVFLFEGEEEAGSAHLGAYFGDLRDLLDPVDLWLIFDGPVHQSGRPQLVFGVRGVASLDVTVYGPIRPLHSGHYGNWAPVPGRLLSQLLATMWLDDGRVAVRGFYDDVIPLDPEARAALDALPNQDAALRTDLGLAASEGDGRLEARLLEPALTVLGLRSADVGAEARNVIPTDATAALGLRLVAGNDPTRLQELIEDHIRRQGYHIVRAPPDAAIRARYARIAQVTRGGGYRAARTPLDHPAARAVIAAARRVAGNDLLLVPGLGGSLPLYLFTETLGKPTVIVPMVNADNNQHAENENVRVGNLWLGMELMAAMLTM